MTSGIAIIFAAVSQTHGLPADLLPAVCWQESRHDAKALNPKDGRKGDPKQTPSYGVCQVKLATARQMGFKGKAKELMKPEINIEYAGKYLAWQIDRYTDKKTKEKNYAQAVTAYNQGSTKGSGGSTYLALVFNAWINKPWLLTNREFASEHP